MSGTPSHYLSPLSISNIIAPLINLFAGDDVRPITRLDWHGPLITRHVKGGWGRVGGGAEVAGWWCGNRGDNCGSLQRLRFGAAAYCLLRGGTSVAPTASICPQSGNTGREKQRKPVRPPTLGNYFLIKVRRLACLASPRPPPPTLPPPAAGQLSV